MPKKQVQDNIRSWRAVCRYYDTIIRRRSSVDFKNILDEDVVFHLECKEHGENELHEGIDAVTLFHINQLNTEGLVADSINITGPMNFTKIEGDEIHVSVQISYDVKMSSPSSSFDEEKSSIITVDEDGNEKNSPTTKVEEENVVTIVNNCEDKFRLVRDDRNKIRRIQKIERVITHPSKGWFSWF